MHRIVSVQDFLETIQRLQLLYVATPMRRGCENQSQELLQVGDEPKFEALEPWASPSSLNS